MQGINKQLALPETNSEFTPENRPGPNRIFIFQPLIFRCYVMLVSVRVSGPSLPEKKQFACDVVLWSRRTNKKRRCSGAACHILSNFNPATGWKKQFLNLQFLGGCHQKNLKKIRWYWGTSIRLPKKKNGGKTRKHLLSAQAHGAQHLVAYRVDINWQNVWVKTLTLYIQSYLVRVRAWTPKNTSPEVNSF